MKKQCFMPYLLLLLAVVTTTLFPHSNALAAPSLVDLDFGRNNVSFNAIGYSQVELKWPRRGVVCRHNATNSKRICRRLKEGQEYTIIDFHDNRRESFKMERGIPAFECRAGSNGNLRNVIWGFNKIEWYIRWDDRGSWVQVYKEGFDSRYLAYGGVGNYIEAPTPIAYYRVDDLTKGGRIYINFDILGRTCENLTYVK